MSVLAKEQMLALLVGFSLKVRLSCGHKRSGESIWFKGKEDYHFNSVLFCLGYREYLYVCAGLKLMCALGSVPAKTKAVVGSLELPGYI